MTYTIQTRTTLGQLCTILWDSQSQPDVIQPGFKPGTVVPPLALRCSALDRCTTRAYPYHDTATTMLENKEAFTLWCVVLDLPQTYGFAFRPKYGLFCYVFLCCCCITLVPCCIHMHVLEYLYSVYCYSSFHSVIIVESLQCCWSIPSFLPSQPLNSIAVLKSAMASW